MTTIMIMNAEAILHSHGYRSTPGRKAFLSLLSERGATDIASLRNAFEEKSFANATTFYRTIAEFRSAGIVHVLGTKRGEVAMLCDCLRDEGRSCRASHSVSYCLSCGSIEESHDIPEDDNVARKFSESHLKSCKNCKI